MGIINNMDYNKFLEEILTSLMHEDGSDLHMGTGRKPAVRINGQLVFLSNQEILKQEDMVSLLKIMLGHEKTAKFLEDKEVDFSFPFKGVTHLRGNAFFQRGNICVALRLVPKAKTFEELNLPEILKTFALKKQGFFLVVGPVGQGKSTTLSTMINFINNESTTHIITI